MNCEFAWVLNNLNALRYFTLSVVNLEETLSIIIKMKINKD